MPTLTVRTFFSFGSLIVSVCFLFFLKYIFQVLSIVLLVLHRLSAVASNYYLGLHILSGRLRGTSVSAKQEYRRVLHTNQRYRWNGKTPNRLLLPATEVPAAKFDIDKDAQIAHARIAVATSNVVGRGPGNSVQRDFLSQAFSDFIFAIIVEELGLIGGAFVVFLYVCLLIRVGRIAKKCR